MTTEAADRLRQAVQRFFRSFGALSGDSTPCGKPLSIAHAHALMVLLTRGELSQQELGLELNIDKSNVARLCAKMVEETHARQRPDAQDGRSRIVSLTARGERLAHEVTASSRTRFDEILQALPKQSRSEVVNVLNQLVLAVEITASVRKEKGKKT